MPENDIKTAVKEALAETNGKKGGVKTTEMWITLIIVLAGTIRNLLICGSPPVQRPQNDVSPHISPAFCYVAASAGVFVVSLGRRPRRPLKVASGRLGRGASQTPAATATRKET